MVKRQPSHFLEFPDLTSTLTAKLPQAHHMILPLRSTKEVWAFDWFDLDVPIQFGSMFILPTCLYVVHRHTRMLLGARICQGTGPAPG